MKKRLSLCLLLSLTLLSGSSSLASESILQNNSISSILDAGAGATDAPAPAATATIPPDALLDAQALIDSILAPRTDMAPTSTPAASSLPELDTTILDRVPIPSVQTVQVPSSSMPAALYVGEAQQNIAIRTSMSREASAIGSYQIGDSVYIIGYEPEWLEVIIGDQDNWATGYVLRHTVSPIYSLGEGYLPYGATPAVYTGTINRKAPLYTEPNVASESLHTFTPGTRIAILEINGGWAKVIHWRQYGYLYLDCVDNMTPVYDAYSAQSGDTISAFISFFSQATTGLNPNRIHNINLSCEYISITMLPGDEFAFNSVAGPYLRTRGYEQAPAYVAGETVPSYGGGTCQVSSTMYNTLLPLTMTGITITHRRPHGPSGAKYLPHGVDAAVGNSSLDLCFRNDYPFAVRIDASAQDGVLYIAIIKA